MKEIEIEFTQEMCDEYNAMRWKICFDDGEEDMKPHKIKVLFG